MSNALPFLLAASGVSLLSMADPALADSAVDAAEAADRVILEPGEIDSSTVAVGSYVVVIHGQGGRYPVSGEWEQLLTSRGYVHAVDAEVLTLFRGWDGEPEWIAVERIQTLVLMGSPSRRAEAGDRMGKAKPISSKAKPASLRLGYGDRTRSRVGKKGTATAAASSAREARDSTQVDTGRSRSNLMETSKTLLRTKRGDDQMGAGKMIANKLGAGVIWGLGGGFVGGSMIAVLGVATCSICRDEGEGYGIVVIFGGLAGGVIGYPVGTAVGVSRIDPDGSFATALGGSVVGFLAARTIGPDNIFDYWWNSSGIWDGVRGSWPYCVGPILGATVATELDRIANWFPKSIFMMRDFPKARRFSVGLMPTPGGGLSTAATLRF